MMRERLLALRERRALLAARAHAERERLAAHLARADAALAWLERGRSALDEARRHPLLLAAVALVVLAWRPRRVLKALAGGWSAWRIYRRARRWWDRLAPLVQSAPGRGA